MQSFVKAATWVHEQKKTNFTPSDLQSADVKPLISDLNKSLQGALEKGFQKISYEMPVRMRQELQDNVFVFSGLKTYNELKAVSQLLLDKKGNVKGWEKFQKDILRVHKTYNINYLKAEYQFATTSAQMAAHWGQVEEDGDRYNLQYRTAGDNRVIDSHVPLNNVTLPQYKNNIKPAENAIDLAIRSASKQADHIVLYIDSEIADGDLRNGIQNRVFRKESIKTITVIRNGNDKIYNREQIIEEDWEL